MLDLKKLKEFQRQFVKEREWEQFHTPKNLVMALAGESGELLEIFQWLRDTEAQEIMNSQSQNEKIQDELADIFFYLVRLSDVLGVDLEAAFWNKMRKNAEKYPVHLAKGKATKYTDLK